LQKIQIFKQKVIKKIFSYTLQISQFFENKIYKKNLNKYKIQLFKLLKEVKFRTE